MSEPKGASNAVLPNWRQSFSRSRIAPRLYAVREPVVSVVEALCGFSEPDQRSFGAKSAVRIGAPKASHSPYLGDSRSAACFLDGGVISVSKLYFVGLSGTWIVGSLALRFMCGAAGVRQPSSRLDGIAPIPHADLQFLLQDQLAYSLKGLEKRIEDFDAQDGQGLADLAVKSLPETEALLLRLKESRLSLSSART